MNSKLKRLAKYFLGLLLIVALAYLVGTKELMTALGYLNFKLMVMLLSISVLLIYISALKWSLFLEALSERVSVLRLCTLYLFGYFVNLLLPSFIGGDVARSYIIGKRIGQHAALTATILERFTGLVAMSLLGFVCMWFSDIVSPLVRVIIVGLTLGLFAISAMACSSKILGLVARFPRTQKAVEHIKKIQAGFQVASRDPGLLVKTMLLSFLFHCCTVFNTAVAAYAVGWLNVPLSELFIVLPIILIIGSIPVSPSGLGIQEGAFFFFLQGIGATPEQALGVGIVLRAKSYVLAILGGLVWLRLPRNVNQEAKPSSFSKPLS